MSEYKAGDPVLLWHDGSPGTVAVARADRGEYLVEYGPRRSPKAGWFVAEALEPLTVRAILQWWMERHELTGISDGNLCICTRTMPLPGCRCARCVPGGREQPAQEEGQA